LLVATGGAFLYHRAKRAAVRRKALEVGEYEKAELPDSATSTASVWVSAAQLHSDEVHELPAEVDAIEADEGAAKDRVELAGDTGVAELENDQLVLPKLEASFKVDRG
jgi:hypothetical protein